MNRESVFEQLKIDEGVVYEIYKDHLGYPTFGVGHLVLESDPEFGQDVGTPVTEERTKECFEKDLDTSIIRMRCIIWRRFHRLAWSRTRSPSEHDVQYGQNTFRQV